MSLIFPKWTNVLPTVLAVGAVSGLAAIVGGFWYYATPKFFAVGYMPTQPATGFSHQLHAGKLGMDCRYCHTKVEQSPEANIPNVATCIGCHAEQRLAAWQTQRVGFVREAYDKDASIEWRRVHKVPDYVRNFPHNAHIRAGVSCYSCHGQITAMPVVFQSQPLSMGWCLDCHRNPGPSLVPPDKVTQLQWVQDHLAARAADPQKSSAEVKSLIDSLQVNPPRNCGACHY